eukprot:jgi/Undpi1/5980/HiC_scaffold_2.g01254.m1
MPASFRIASLHYGDDRDGFDGCDGGVDGCDVIFDGFDGDGAGGGFSGDPIALRPGAPTGNNVSKRSETHYITLQKDGNLVLREGKPGDPFGAAPVWESGRVDPKKDCAKCVFMLDTTGQQLQVKRGRKVLKEFNVAEDALLSAAIKTP